MMGPLAGVLGPLATRRMAGGGAFAPSSLTGIQVVYDPSVGTYQDAAKTTPASANNDPVGAIVGQPGSVEATQGTAIDRPTLKTNVLNSLPAISHDGTDLLVGTGLTATNAFTLFAVLKQAGTGNRSLWGLGNTAGGLDVGVTAAHTVTIIRANQAIVATSLSAISSTAYDCLIVRFTGSSYLFRLNGADDGSGSASSTFSGTGHKLGAHPNGTANKFNGLWAYLGYCDVAISDEEVSLLETYIAQRFGLGF